MSSREFFQKTNKLIHFYYYATCFHSFFWKKLKSPKKLFKIIWPLRTLQPGLQKQWHTMPWAREQILLFKKNLEDSKLWFFHRTVNFHQNDKKDESLEWSDLKSIIIYMNRIERTGKNKWRQEKQDKNKTRKAFSLIGCLNLVPFL